MNSYRTVEVRDFVGTLSSLYKEYRGRGHASFEGDLSGLGLSDLSGSSGEESTILKRQTRSPRLDFVVILLTNENIASLIQILAGQDLLGPDGAIIHTQLEVEGKLAFSACDNFHLDCTVASPVIPEKVLASLKATGQIHSYGEL